MQDYHTAVVLLGLRDGNMPVFKSLRERRLQSIEKISKLINICPRLKPVTPPNFLTLDEQDPEWDDKMIFPVMNWRRFWGGLAYWGLLTGFYVYNWNVLHTNLRLRLLGYAYPFISIYFLSHSALLYLNSMKKIHLFDNYVNTRAQELFEQNQFILDHTIFERSVYFEADLQETLARVHRQANNHDASDFKDSELILQDFIRRHSDVTNPDAAMFYRDGVKLLN